MHHQKVASGAEAEAERERDEHRQSATLCAATACGEHPVPASGNDSDSGPVFALIVVVIPRVVSQAATSANRKAMKRCIAGGDQATRKARAA